MIVEEQRLVTLPAQGDVAWKAPAENHSQRAYSKVLQTLFKNAKGLGKRGQEKDGFVIFRCTENSTAAESSGCILFHTVKGTVKSLEQSPLTPKMLE